MAKNFQLVDRLTEDRRVAGSSLTAGGVTRMFCLSKAFYLLLSTGSTQEDLSRHDQILN